MILIPSCIFAQNKKVKERKISLVEEFTDDEYKMPDSILFYSGGHWEIEKYYNILYRKLSNEIRGIDGYYDYKFQENANIPIRINSFDDLKIKFNNNNYNAICVFALGDIDREFPNGYVNSIAICSYDFYMILLQSKTNKVLLKRKFRIIAKKIYYSENKRLAKYIVNELQKL
ncbi:hypothetical protein GCM10023315_05130 [Algibacter aquimarinus]|uniref:Uncharacterized protein n=2 Tax=Algibacter aquimarinus TaxID=1136748 RepID=A0ABP9H249_9FLAO